MVVGISVGVVAVCLFLWIGISGRCRLVGGSLCVGCLRFVVSGIVLCRYRLRVVGGRGCVVLWVMLLAFIRWDLRGVMAGTVACRDGGGQG